MLEFVKVVECRVCHKRRSLIIPLNEYLLWRYGIEEIQVALPQMPAGDRELLKSGICGDCLDGKLQED